jgi:hypothetical protein
MASERIDFSCLCGRRLTAVIRAASRRRAARLELFQAGKRCPENRCPTVGCRSNYRGVGPVEFKERVHDGW